jgi:thiol-disulfide isomerase/thioredoxin
MRPELGDVDLQNEPGLMPNAGSSSGPTKKLVVALICVVAAIGLGAAGFKVLRPSGGGWLHSLDDGLDLAETSGKPVLALFTADWCPPCRRLKQGVLADPDVKTSLAEDYVLVKVDLTDRRGQNNWVASDAGVKYIPTIIIYDEGYETRRFGASEFESWVYFR